MCRPTILNLGTGWTPWETVSGTHCVAGSVRLWAGIDAEKKGNIFCSFSPIQLRFLDCWARSTAVIPTELLLLLVAAHSTKTLFDHTANSALWEFYVTYRLFFPGRTISNQKILIQVLNRSRYSSTPFPVQNISPNWYFKLKDCLWTYWKKWGVSTCKHWKCERNYFRQCVRTRQILSFPCITSERQAVKVFMHFKEHEEFRDLYSSPSIIRIIKSRRRRWAGHVARMGRILA
jgi:hypothetical protein